MKFKRIISMVFSLLIASVYSNMPAKAVDIQNSTYQVAADNIDTAGLIENYYLAISSSTKQISITAWTYGSDVMASIGFKNIEIQYSSNGTSGWLMEYSLADDLVTNETSHTKNSESHGVHGGYYYRVVLDHYAKETGFWFPDSESIPNTSNVVWVPRS